MKLPETHALYIGAENGTTPLKMIPQFFMKLCSPILYNPFIIFLGIYSRERKIYVHIRTSTRMCIEVLIIIVLIQKKLLIFTHRGNNKLNSGNGMTLINFKEENIHTDTNNYMDEEYTWISSL